MKKVMVINEESHGVIGVAQDFKAALLFLIKEHWIDKNTYIYFDDTKGRWITAYEAFGEEWQSKIFTIEEDVLCNAFDGMFYFNMLPLYT